MRLFLSLFFLIGVGLNTPTLGQTFIDKFTSIFEFELHRKNRDTSHYVTKLVLAPTISYEPATSLGFGVGSKFLFKPPNATTDTRTSNIPISVQYTLKNQIIFNSSYTVFLPQERWLLKGNLGFSKFPITFFGVGNNTQSSDQIEISYHNLLLEPLLLRKLKKNFFVGAGIRYRRSYNVKIARPEDASQGLRSAIASTSVGAEFALNWDSRNNVLNATEGNFLEAKHGFYEKILGGSVAFMLSELDYRKYTQLRQSERDILAYQLYARTVWGEVSLLELSALGGAELLRGFPEARFIDRAAYFTQVEYRWQTFRRIGMVFYAGTGTVRARGEPLSINTLKYSLGTGIRLKIVESENLNIRLDYALGFANQRTSNFYLGIAEAF